MNHRRLILPCLLAIMLVACKRPAEEGKASVPAPDATQAQQSPSAKDATSPAAAPASPAVEAAAKPEIPALRVATVDGKPYDLAAHRGHWVVVNFWATWCAPCLKEMPELSALDAMRENIEVVGLAYEDIEVADMRAFLKKHPVVYPIAIIDVYNPPADFTTPRGLPMTYLIAPDGKVAKQFLGPVTSKDIEGAMTAAGAPKAERPASG
jgi:thiol-disulfide isomerase/thioredoxin